MRVRVVDDYRMIPDGITVLRAFRAENPDCYRILLTASYATIEIRDAMLADDVHMVLSKPVTLQEFRSALSVALAAVPR